MSQKINGTESLHEVLYKLSEGNPGALTALMEAIAVDPISITTLMVFDTWGIYGSSIYILWNDKCGRDTEKFIKLVIATQVEDLPVSRLKELAADQMRSANLTDEELEVIEGQTIG